MLGSIIGGIGAWAAGFAMQRVLFEIPPFHLPTFLQTFLTLGVVTIIASLIPALRAARVNPMEALNND